jgi:hypothetical protein
VTSGERAVWRFVADDADAVDPRRRGSRSSTTRHSVLSRVDDGLRDGPAPVCSSVAQTAEHRTSVQRAAIVSVRPAYSGALSPPFFDLLHCNDALILSAIHHLSLLNATNVARRHIAPGDGRRRGARTVDRMDGFNYTRCSPIRAPTVPSSLRAFLSLARLRFDWTVSNAPPLLCWACLLTQGGIGH